MLYSPIVTGLVPLMSTAGRSKNHQLSAVRAERENIKKNLDIENKTIITKNQRHTATKKIEKKKHEE